MYDSGLGTMREFRTRARTKSNVPSASMSESSQTALRVSFGSDVVINAVLTFAGVRTGGYPSGCAALKSCVNSAIYGETAQDPGDWSMDGG